MEQHQAPQPRDWVQHETLTSPMAQYGSGVSAGAHSCESDSLQNFEAEQSETECDVYISAWHPTRLVQ